MTLIKPRSNSLASRALSHPGIGEPWRQCTNPSQCLRITRCRICTAVAGMSAELGRLIWRAGIGASIIRCLLCSFCACKRSISKIIKNKEAICHLVRSQEALSATFAWQRDWTRLADAGVEVNRIVTRFAGVGVSGPGFSDTWNVQRLFPIQEEMN